uniref:Ecdysone receptor n=1 Tax=Lutzomyia longipalpis TaxID=7200 RepID=A0A1B0CT48_LUTLO
MMKRRWSNNGGFALRMLEESSSEVTSSSAALVMSPGMTMSPTSLGSPEYGELELWSYDENAYHHHGVIAANANTGCGPQNPNTVIPLPSITTTISHTPRSESANSISS